MAILNPEHLFEQAEKLIMPPGAGAPRQADLRRAISAAYYGIFHAILGFAADEFVGATKRTSKQYSLVYRSIHHHSLRVICVEIEKPKLSARYLPYQPANGFGPNIQSFAAAFLELQEKRHAADYDPLFRVRTSEASLLVKAARDALDRFRKASKPGRKVFLTLLLFPPR